MNSEVEQIMSCIRRRDSKTALSLMASIEGTRGLCARLQVLKAMCLQLTDQASLEDVEASLLKAIELDDQYVDAFVELGWFRLSVLDDARKAMDSFERARSLLEKLNGEVFRGMLACAEELRPDEHRETIKKALRRSLMLQAEESQGLVR